MEKDGNGLVDKKKLNFSTLTVRDKIIMIVSVLMAFYHLYYATIGFIAEISWRSGHLIFASILIILCYPLSKKGSIVAYTIDYGLILLSIIVGFYVMIVYPQMEFRAGCPVLMDTIMGMSVIIIVLEITRRTLGWSLVIVGLIAFLYCFAGPYLPGLFGHRGFYFDRAISQMYMTIEGVYGLPLGVMVKYVYFFLLFAGFLDVTGAGKWFINFAYSLTGRTRSGPALAAVVASGFMGSVSGSAVANVVATGSFTIPLMKKVGYKPEVAGAIEAAASTGGQLMPPIMGAGAFIIAEWTGIPYKHIIIVSLIPALLYYFSVGAFVYIRALKIGIQIPDKSTLPSFKKEFFKGLHYLLAIFILAFMIVKGYSATYSVCIAIGALIVVSSFKKESRLTIPIVIHALVDAAKKAIPVSAACAAAGLVVGAVGLTGLGLKFSAMVISVAGGNLFLAILFVMGAAIFLGMGLPVTAAYIVLAVLAVPGLTELGLPPLIAHMVIFWCSQLSNLTPPVCLAAYAAAGIAGGKPMETGFRAFALAKGFYIIPFLFVYTPHILLTEGFPRALQAGFFGLLGLVCITVALEGYFIERMSILTRISMLIAAVLILWPDVLISIVGVCLILVILALQIIPKLREAH